MALPTPGPGRQGLVSFRLLGFPVSIHTSFLLVVVLLRWTGAQTTVGDVVSWVVVVTVSVIAHELGHALVAAPAGGNPRIDLYGLAGLTTWDPRRAGRGRLLAVSLAGPAAGVALGLGVVALRSAVSPEPGTLLSQAFRDAVFVNLAWGLFNLLPMMPLDGGQVVRSLMPGDEATRLRRTAWLSLAVAAAAGFAAVRLHRPAAALFVAFVAAGNLQTISAGRRRDVRDPLAAVEHALIAGGAEEALRLLPDSDEPRPLLLRAMALMRLGRAREAQAVLVDHDLTVDPVFEAAVLLANGQERLARERLGPLLAGSPPEWAVAELAEVLLRRGDDLDDWLGGLRGGAAGGAVSALYRAGRYADAARWGDHALATGGDGPYLAWNTAVCHARAGETDRALRALDHAALLGFADVERADTHAGLADVRGLAGWPDVRARIEANAGSRGPYAPR